MLLAVTSTAFAAGPRKTRARPAARVSATGLITHTPPTEQAVMTPVPIWVEARDETVARVILRYKSFGSPSWTAVDMTKSEAGWSGEVPCREVGTVTGVLRYYVTAYDAEGNTVGSHGTMKKPNKVKIRRAIKSAPPHLPGRQPPAKCYDPTDCPPGFPGCSSKPLTENSCMVDDDCDEGMVCSPEQHCEAPPDKQKKNWISIGGLQDIVFLSNANYCAPENQDSGQFSCLRQEDGVPYQGTPLPEAAALVYGPATTRVTLGYDRFVSSHFALGIHAGYVVRGLAPALENRKASPPILLEGRIAYWFNSEAAVRPVLYLAGGYAPVDFKFRAFVEEDRTAPATQQNPDSQTLDIWTTRGPYFAGLGAGLMFATSSGTGFLLDVEGVGTFPTVATLIRPGLSFLIGF
jgi:hypothetical protein